ncbi:helix-turn-helix domain-containing protein [Microvirga sp. HBU67558]|nr:MULTISPECIES: helix-turn-helix domain-containing protein [unclassified Microvirga]MBQ0820026.1 helix-turn-helix domain-containing protein [Microvirga sp. HBU67558]
MNGAPKLLTEPEVAEILRCSTRTVARMREAGKLPYIPGRPVLIDEADLLAYIASRKRTINPQGPKPEPGAPEYEEWINQRGNELARKMWMKSKLKAVVKSLRSG